MEPFAIPLLAWMRIFVADNEEDLKNSERAFNVRSSSSSLFGVWVLIAL